MPRSNESILRKHPLATVFVTVFICLLPILTQRDYTPMNELRYLSIADETLENDHVFILTNHGEPYADKPSLYIWLIMLSKILFGHYSMFFLSFLSLIPAFITVAVMDKWIFEDDRKNSLDRMAMAFMLCSSGLFLVLTFYLRMDMMMTMFIMLALYSFHLMYSGRGNPKLQSWLMPLWIFLALFTKGPVGLLVPILTIIIFLIVKKEPRKIGRYIGFKTLGVIAGLCLLWFLGVLAEPGGKEYLYDLTIHQTFGRAVNSFHHNRPFYYYFKNIWLIVFPYTILVFAVITAALFSKKKMKTGPKSDNEVIMLIGFWATFAFLCIISSKLILYLMPMVPFAIYGFYLSAKRMEWKPWIYALLEATTILMMVTALALIIVLRLPNFKPLSILVRDYPFMTSHLTMCSFIIMLIGNVLAFIYIRFKKMWQKGVMFIAVSWLLGIYCCSFQMNQINDVIGYGGFSKAIPEGTNVASINVRRPENIDVYIGREITKNYEKDTTAFKNDLANGTLQRPVTLIVSDKMLRKGFNSFCEQNGDLLNWYGPYALVYFEEEDDSPIQDIQ